jgi:hypothetical protein
MGIAEWYHSTTQSDESRPSAQIFLSVKTIDEHPNIRVVFKVKRRHGF